MNYKERYFQIWNQVWCLHKKYYGTQEQEKQRWRELDKECELLHKKYTGAAEQKFLESLLLAVIGELERQSRN